jgi:hypothetical protein
MRNFILPLLAMLTLSSCFTYQYFTVDSSQLQKDDQKMFTMENDTLRLTYSFSGIGGQLAITVFNKTTQPLFINWAKSVLIRNDQSYSLYGTNSAFAGSATSTGYGTANLTGTVNVSPGMEFIPPQTKIARTTIELDQAGASVRTAMPDTAHKQRTTLKDGAIESYLMASYNEAQSPVRWKSYLTFVIGQGAGAEFTEGHTFFVGTLIETKYDPTRFNLYQYPGDQFYIFWGQQTQ